MAERKVINAGKYRHRVTLKQAPPITTRNDYGERTQSGATIATVWAEKQDWAGNESDEFGRETAQTTVKWLIRWRADIEPSCQLVFAGETYDIEAALDYTGTRRELVLICKKVQ
jgi:SPP1 family predicted phage head-tail adaptor